MNQVREVFTFTGARVFEFLIMVVFSMLFMGGFFLLQGWLRVPRYRLERDEFRDLLVTALAGRVRIERWEMIIGMPVRHDEQLETWRNRLARMADSGRPGTRDCDGMRCCHFNTAEREQLQRILQEMDCVESGETERRF